MSTKIENDNLYYFEGELVGRVRDADQVTPKEAHTLVNQLPDFDLYFVRTKAGKLQLRYIDEHDGEHQIVSVTIVHDDGTFEVVKLNEEIEY
jgi:hypothetical protein